MDRTKRDRLYRFVVNEVAVNGGSLETTISKWHEVCGRVVGTIVAPTEFLSDCSFLSCKKRGDNLIALELTPTFELCSTYIKRDGCTDKNCPNIHCCLHYLLGDCIFGFKCKYSHKLLDNHNIGPLRSNFMDTLNEKELAEVLKIKHKVAASMPLLCRGYNSSQDCKFGSKCMSLHLCSFYVSNECKHGKKCKRSHDLSGKEIRDVLLKRGIDPHRKPSDILIDIREAIAASKRTDSSSEFDGNVEDSSGRADGNSGERMKKDGRLCLVETIKNVSLEKNNAMEVPRLSLSPAGDVKSPSKLISNSEAESIDDNKESKSNVGQSDKEAFICTFYLRGKCLYKDDCAKIHPPDLLPYLWQYESGISNWVNFSQNKEIEQRYCSNEDSYKVPVSTSTVGILYVSPFLELNLDKMTWTQSYRIPVQSDSGKMRRLSTEAQTDASKGYQFLTSWNWFWKADDNIWQQYEDQDGYPSSDKIEAVFREDQSRRFPFSAGRWSYELDFQHLVQINIRTNRKRAIRRRPDFFDEKTKMPKSNSKFKKDVNTGLQISLPDNWKNLQNDGRYHLVNVSRTDDSNEFCKLETLFRKTTSMPIKTLTRIENAELWNFFRMKHLSLLNKSEASGRHKLLFHGTNDMNVDAICQQGFDFRLSGTSNGTRLGKGSYFARDAKYSCNFSTCRKMFVAKVIIGEFKRGHSGYMRPPIRDSLKHDMYESCVDNELNPTIFVVFDNSQAYPEYLIEY